MSVGQRLKQFRKSLKLSQGVFGKIINVDQTTISKYENDEIPLSSQTKAAIHVYFDLREEWLDFGSGEMVENNFDMENNLAFANEFRNDILGPGLLGKAISKVDTKERFPISYEAITLTSGVHAISVNDDCYLVRLPIVGLDNREFCTKFNSTEYLSSLPFHFFQAQFLIEQYVAFINYGRDMDDGTNKAIRHGDCVIADPFTMGQLDAVYEADRIFVIVHKERMLLRKITHFDSDIIYCTALNNDKGFYPDLSIKKKEIKQLYLVHQIERTLLV